ncbi:peptide-methionine (S)-S-oxide reductase MsrA [Rubrobacter indicoceani]|uniref:peptide-methionine (S)-S-oxide reductase MsrA n=1 Tax=Rubrobacter indicoceani TaxID=2051957 RepID=UPI000E5AF73F|nr:peptide-methionine (S)-S-oxide reductase MsrA [Rubrobacter indicoceani]
MSRNKENGIAGGARETATLGGGCFWCVEAVFDGVKGVESIVSGYSGGHVDNPTYRQVCAGTTGHIEVVQVTFDPDEITFRDVLDVFFATHDPTTWDRQGADVGPQYRSAVLYHDEEQKRVAEETIKDLDSQGIFDGDIVTVVEPFEKFYTAEEYHQDYFKNNPAQPYCQVIIAPKVAKFRKENLRRLKA